MLLPENRVPEAPLDNSLESINWRKLYYPVYASEVSTHDALAHSTRKWEGLQPEVLSTMRVIPIVLGGRYCALCVHYRYTNARQCCVCPLYRSRGGVTCFDEKPGEDRSPWYVWVEDQNGVPMLQALREAKLVGTY